MAIQKGAAVGRGPHVVHQRLELHQRLVAAPLVRRLQMRFGAQRVAHAGPAPWQRDGGTHVRLHLLGRRLVHRPRPLHPQALGKHRALLERAKRRVRQRAATRAATSTAAVVGGVGGVGGVGSGVGGGVGGVGGGGPGALGSAVLVLGLIEELIVLLDDPSWHACLRRLLRRRRRLSRRLVLTSRGRVRQPKDAEHEK